MNHKRKRPKNRRAGCLMCKPHKGNGAGAEKDTANARRRMQADAPGEWTDGGRCWEPIGSQGQGKAK